MDKILLINNQEFTLIPCGIDVTSNKLLISFTSDLLDTKIKDIFKNQNNTSTITLLSGNSEYLYEGYIEYKGFSERIESEQTVYTITLEKKDIQKIVDEMTVSINELNNIIDLLIVETLESGV